MENLADYYSAEYDKILDEVYSPMYHENGFDFKSIPILTAENPNQLLMYNWGLIPWFTKSIDDGLKLRVQTLNCRSEQMYKTNSFKDSAKEGKRCLILCTGFYEWRWDNSDDKKSDRNHIAYF
jgi:putative SOS response-associated peptidase YedK